MIRREKEEFQQCSLDMLQREKDRHRILTEAPQAS
eukprot:CAMPEP_0181495346 /NCGR_PEP_ID=MMETSP1110-20121109/52322_1 /TAXON_ID=174948 /ORGANISM="Symbiodinium sp., Strain CCMP421" /LENGTH=34 /DNA_ID= /DNA_START= /DNA_END= /DNA_ORIENTATION=